MKEHTLFHSFREFIRKKRLIGRGEKIIVAVSGGIDSMVILHLLCELRNRLRIELAIAHFNHRLRGLESDMDEVFVRRTAHNRSLECYVESSDTKENAKTNKLSIQTAARNLRYDFLKRLIGAIGFHKIATAHNADDNAETILLNVIRGTGIHGMSGIPSFREDGAIIRPLLFAPREMIRRYADENRIEFREDSSNEKIDYTRNFIRHNLIPLIRENLNPNLTATLGRSGELFTHLEEYIQKKLKPILKKMVLEKVPDHITIALPLLKSQPIFIREQLLKLIGEGFAGRELDYNAINNMAGIVQSETGSSCSIAKGIVFCLNRDQVIFKRRTQPRPFSFRVDIGKKYRIDSFSFESVITDKADINRSPYIEFIDAAAIKKRLSLRSWRAGDWFIPLGMSKRKKVSDFFIDQKVPLSEKHSIPILSSGDRIVWICGMRLDNRFKIKHRTEKYVKLTYTPVRR